MSFSHFIATASPPEGHFDICTNDAVTFTFKTRSHGRRHTHMYLFYITDRRSFTVTRGEMIEAHAALETTLDAIWSSSTTIQGAIKATAIDKVVPSPLFDHQRYLADVGDIVSDRLTILRNGLSFLDECEKLSIVPTLWVNSPSLQTILPLARSSQANGPIAMYRRPLDIVYNMKRPVADAQLLKAAALVAKTDELCAKFSPSPLARRGAIKRDSSGTQVPSGTEVAGPQSERKSSETTQVEHYEEMVYCDPCIKAKTSIETESRSSEPSSYATATNGLCNHCGHSVHCAPTRANSRASNHGDASCATIHVTQAAPMPGCDSRDFSTKPAKPRNPTHIASLAGRGARSHSLEGYNRNTVTAIDYKRRASEGSNKPCAVASVPRCPNHDSPVIPPDIEIDAVHVAALDIAKVNVNKPLPEIYNPPRSESSRKAKTAITSCPRSSASSQTSYVTGHCKTTTSTRTSERSHKSRNSKHTDKSSTSQRHTPAKESNRAAWVSAKSTPSSSNSYNTAATCTGTGIDAPLASENRPTKEASKSSRSSRVPTITSAYKGRDAAVVSEKYYTPPSSGSGLAVVPSKASTGSSITESSNSDSSTISNARTEATFGSKHTQFTTRTPDKGHSKVPPVSGTSDRSYTTAPDVFDSFVPEKGTHTLRPTGRRRISRAPKDSRSDKTSQSDSTSPKSHSSYITAPTSAPRSKRDVVTESIDQDSKLISEIHQILGDHGSPSSTVRAVVSDNRYLDSKEKDPTIVYNTPHTPIKRSDTVCAVVSYNTSPGNTPNDVPTSHKSVSSPRSSSTARPTHSACSTSSSTIRAVSSSRSTGSSTVRPLSTESSRTASAMSLSSAYPPSTVRSGFSGAPSTMSTSTAYPPSTLSSGVSRSTMSSSAAPPSPITGSSASSSSTVVPDTPWWLLPKNAPPLSKCGSSVPSVAAVLRGKRGDTPWSNSTSSAYIDSSSSISARNSVNSATVTLQSTSASRYPGTVVSAASSNTHYTENGTAIVMPPRSARSTNSHSSSAAVVGTLRRG